MAILGIHSAKGGVGCSLLATNLGCALTGFGTTALIDLHPGSGVDDLLLDLSPRRSWLDLLPVAKELQSAHFELGRCMHKSGLELYAAPGTWVLDNSLDPLRDVVEALSQRVEWLILDTPRGLNPLSAAMLPLAREILLVTTADPIALRSTKLLIEQLPPGLKDTTGLVINQFTRRHPTKPRQLADAIGIELSATLPADVRGVGYQVNFGQPSIMDPRSTFGRGVAALASRLHQRLNVELIGS